MAVSLFAGIAVSDFAEAVGWYKKLFGTPPSFYPHDTEAVWQVAENRFVYIVERPERAGNAVHAVIVDDLDTLMAEITQRGISPVQQETYSNGTRKITYADSDGNE